MFEGDMEEGELEIGQVAAALKKTEPAATIFNRMLAEFKVAKEHLAEISF